jgi:putative acetyltransferase
VNEQNPQSVGFYLHTGFKVVGCSELDGMGKPYPLLHLRLRKQEGIDVADH